MKEDEIEEVELDLAGEDEPSAGPVTGSSDEPDEAALAFARLEGEMAMMRRAVQQLATERADIDIPDYTVTLGQMAGRLDTMSKSLTSIGERPAIKLTPEAIADQIKGASAHIQRENYDLCKQASTGLDNATGQLNAIVGNVRTDAEQKRQVWHYARAGLLAGILLWSILPGTVARAMPDSWHWPERMAGRLLGESSRWNAGSRMMQSADPQAWHVLVTAADLQRDNRDKIEDCRKRANSSKQSVSCTIKFPPGN